MSEMNEKPVSLDELKTPENYVDVTAGKVAAEEEVVDSTTPVTPTPIVAPKEVAIGDIREYKEPEKKETLLDDAMSKLDEVLESKTKRQIEETKKEAYEIMEKNIQEEEDKKALSEITTEDGESSDVLGDLFKDEDSDKEETSNKSFSTPINITRHINLNTDDVDVEDTLKNLDGDDFLKDLDDEFEDEESEEDIEDRKKSKEEEDRQVEQVKAAAREKIVPFKNKINLGEFNIARKPVNVNRIFETATSDVPTATWVMYNANRPICMSGLKGPEIDKLNPQNSNNNRLNTYREIYKLIYEHVVDANKPSFESWIKTFRFFDINHIYFALYMATFSGSNSVPFTCEKCKEVFMADLEFKDMIKFSTPEIKEKFMNILEKDTTTEKDEYNVSLYQVSDDFVIALRIPTVYNVIFETAALPENVSKKYADMLGIMSYIDTFYHINVNTKELEEVNLYPVPNNAVKTTMHKFKIFYQILNTLTSDQYYTLTGYIKKINDDNDKIRYIKPEVTCPNCGAVIEEEDMAPEGMLFMRHQLGAIANI